ncbi:unnamed protein product, partial [Amoebophrya sp. A120]
ASRRHADADAEVHFCDHHGAPVSEVRNAASAVVPQTDPRVRERDERAAEVPGLRGHQEGERILRRPPRAEGVRDN